jgi:hypothetical protein
LIATRTRQRWASHEEWKPVGDPRRFRNSWMLPIAYGLGLLTQVFTEPAAWADMARHPGILTVAQALGSIQAAIIVLLVLIGRKIGAL